MPRPAGVDDGAAVGEVAGRLALGLDARIPILECDARRRPSVKAVLVELIELILAIQIASTRLDPATEARLERAIDKLLQGRTAIIIAHRLHTVQRADEIMILESGSVSEYGRRTRLVSDPGSRFYQLLQTGLEEVLA